MRVLLTGSSGFIGTHLTRELHAHGHDVFGVDWRSSQMDDPNPALDLRLPGVFRNLLRKYPCDAVIHLAAQVGRLFGEDDILHTISSNAEMTALVAHACGEHGVRLIYTSTSEVYGDQGSRVCYEQGPFTLPHNLYGLSKRWGEEVAQLYAPRDLAIVRPSMPYGPGAPPGRGRRAMDNMLWQAHHRKPITVHRGAERDWCWVGDLVSAYRMILEEGEVGPFNVGREDDPRTMKEIALMACTFADAPYDLIVEVDPPANQTVVKRLSTSRIRSLSWMPTVELEEGMIQVYEWIKNFDAEGNWVK